MTAPDPADSVTIRRADQPGDLDWVVTAHGAQYDEEFGWDDSFRRLVAEIVEDYARDHDPDREAGWIAGVDGRRVGCIFCVATDDVTTAQLRILLVTAEARGLGVGTRLVDECVRFARTAGYRRLTLWTNDVLTSLHDEEPHHSFGHDLVGQNWVLDLD